MDHTEGRAKPNHLKLVVPSVEFKDWQGRIQAASDIDDLVQVVRSYLQAWKPRQLRHLPWNLAATAVPSSEAIVGRAVLTARAELMFQGNEEEHHLLLQMSLTLSAAATRLRFLKGFNNYL
jgi:hypothetical protein